MADKAPIKVVITGAAGQIGYSLIYMVSSGYVFGADQPVVLHLLDIAPMMGVLGGVVMEIADCAMPLVKDVIATDDAVKAFTVSANRFGYFKYQNMFRNITGTYFGNREYFFIS